MYTATYKNRACSKKAATAVKVSALHAKMAAKCDVALEKEAAKEERKARRAEFKQQRLDRRMAA